jgi:hypothetical protein
MGLRLEEALSLQVGDIDADSCDNLKMTRKEVL